MLSRILVAILAGLLGVGLVAVFTTNPVPLVFAGVVGFLAVLLGDSFRS